jgi:hypothetical protein
MVTQFSALGQGLRIPAAQQHCDDLRRDGAPDGKAVSSCLTFQMASYGETIQNWHNDCVF